MSESVRPGQVYWNAKTQAHAVVFDVWVRRAKVVILSERPTRSVTWTLGAPPGWELRYSPPPWKRK